MALKRPISEQDAFLRLSARCAMGEHCEADVRRMMQRWELPDGAADRIVCRLGEERYIDERRFAHAFVRDKFRYNRWGKMRIERELRLKGIAAAVVAEALTELNDDDSLATLRQLLKSKSRSMKGQNDYEVRGKLIRFALSRGFSYADAQRVLSEDFDFSDDDEPVF